MKTYFKDVDGIKTEMIVSDGISDPIFVFHGNSSSASAYQSLLSSPVGQRYQIISVSLPGHGQSSYFDDTKGVLPITRIGEFTSQVTSLFDADRYILMGQSLGGHALLESLPLHRKAIGLALISAPPFSSETIADVFLEDPTQGLLFKNVLSEEDSVRFASAFTHRESTATIHTLAQDIQRTNGEFREQLGASLAKGLILDELQILKASGLPALLLQGDQDRFISQAYYKSLDHNDWPLKVVRFADAGHALQLDSPREFERVLSAFFADTFTHDSTLRKLKSSATLETNYASI